MSGLTDKPRILLEQDNIISLRAVFVLDDGDVVRFQLMPTFQSSIPQAKDRNLDWAIQDCAWLFRHQRSEDAEEELMRAFPCIQHDLMPMSFTATPIISVLWANSGNGIAIFLDGEPWAFNDEATHKEYSKGILKPMINGFCWDQQLFEQRFDP